MFRRKTTFAFFIAAALFASQVFAANPWLAEKNGQSILKAELPPCTADGPAQNRAFTVRDCTTKISCASTGTETVRMVCDGTTWRALNATATAVDLGDYVPVTKAGAQNITASGGSGDVNITASRNLSLYATAGTVDIAAEGAGKDVLINSEDDTFLNATDRVSSAADNFLGTYTTGALFDAPIVGGSGVIERSVANVTVADDAAGTKPAAVIPITTDFVTCTCNDATGCAASVAEPTPTANYGRSLTILSKGTGNCEFADSAGVLEIGTTVVLEPTSVLTLVYMNSAWNASSYKDNVP